MIYEWLSRVQLTQAGSYLTIAMVGDSLVLIIQCITLLLHPILGTDPSTITVLLDITGHVQTRVKRFLRTLAIGLENTHIMVCADGMATGTRTILVIHDTTSDFEILCPLTPTNIQAIMRNTNWNILLARTILQAQFAFKTVSCEQVDAATT